MTWTFFHKLGSPKYFYNLSGKLLPWFSLCCALFFAYGLVGGLFLSPPDYQQGDGFRIIYVHVPSAMMSMGVYSIMAISAFIALVWRMKLADAVVAASAPIGAWFTFLALFTGAVWGKPMWGTWWVWDARLTSELILLFIYFGIIALRHAIRDKNIGAKAVQIFVLVGSVNIPIIHYSVKWWNTLHQGATITKFQKPSISPEMLYPLLAMILAFGLYYAVVLLIRIRCELIKREEKTNWVQQIVRQA